MAWEYLESKTYRYEFIKEKTSNLGDVIELCNGTGIVESYLDCSSYKGCDIANGIKDDDFVKTIDRCDTLIALGHGGFEMDRNPLESATLTQSINYVIKKFKPKNLILESVNRYQSIITGIVKNTNYIETHKHEATGNSWVDNRTLRIFVLGDKNIASNYNDKLWIDVMIPYEPNNGLALAYNRAIESTSAEWILLLDHDIFICNPFWYEMCLSAIKQTEGRKVGWITAVTNRIGGGPQLVKAARDTDSIIDHAREAAKRYKKYGDEVTLLTGDLSGFFILTNKTAWRDIGGFKDVGKKIFGIDNDYRKRLAENGYELYIMKGLYFYHLYRGKARALKDFYE